MNWLRAFWVPTIATGRGRQGGRHRAPRWISLLLAPVTAVATGTAAIPVSAVAAGAVAVTAAGVVAAGAAPARAASGTALILSTSVNGGSSSAEAKAASNLGYTVTVATPSTWDAMTTAQFKTYSLLIIGDPSTGTTCASTVPSDALSTAGTWGPAVTGNVAVLGTAPALAGTAGTSLIGDSVGYAVAGGGTGLYVSLNCEYSTAAANTAVPLLASMDHGGFTVTGQSGACPDSGTVNKWEADSSGAFSGLSSSALASWASPACSVQETVTAWPAGFTPVAYGVTSGSFASPADFTASDGVSGQPYVLLGSPVSAGTAALAPSAGGEVPAGTTAGGAGNPAAPGVSAASAGDPVNTENGDFSQSATDLSVPTYGPALTFSRTYDALLAQQQTQTATPGPLGYGWTDNWASSLTMTRPVPADIYTISGPGTDTGDGGPATSAPLNAPGGVTDSNGNIYVADSAGNRVQEIPAASGTQWGISMTAGDVYTIAGSPTGVQGDSPSGTAASASLLFDPSGVAVDDSGDLFIADTGNDRVAEIAASSAPWGNMANPVAGDLYTVAGVPGQPGTGGDAKAATSSDLSNPVSVFIGGYAGGDLYIADAWNNRIQMVSQISQTRWGQSMSPYDVYTVAGSATGTAGDSGDGSNAHTSALLDAPENMSASSAGDLYIADSGNNRIQEVPKVTGTQWGISMTADDMYTVAGSASGSSGHSGDGGKATSALLDFPTAVTAANSQQLYVTDSGNNRIQEVARTAHTEFGQSMTANDAYTIAGSSSGTGGFSGDSGAATSALLEAPTQVALDGSFDVYIVDTFNNRVREVSASTAKISEFAGNGGTFAQDGDGGPAVTAGLFQPGGEAADAAGDIYIADLGNNRVQEIAATSHTQWGIAMTAGDVYTIAGSAIGLPGLSGDGGPARSALLNGPDMVVVDAAGDVFIADEDNNRIQEIAAATGSQRGQSMTASDIYTVAGSAAGNAGDSGNGGTATSALMSFPEGMAIDHAGDLYIADYGNNRVQEVPVATGSQWGQSMTANDMYTIAGSAAGIGGTSGDGGPATSALLSGSSGITLDGAGNLYIADYLNNRVQEVPAATSTQRGRSMTRYDMYTIAGSSAGTGGITGDGGTAASALLNAPNSIASDAAGNLYIADSVNNRVQEIAVADGTQWGTSMTANDIYTVAGSATGVSGDSGDGGPATSALLDTSGFVSVDAAGNLYVTDVGSSLLREVTATTATTITPAPGQTSWLAPAPGGITVSQPGGAQVTFYAQSGGTCTAPYVKAGGYCALPQDVGATLTYSSGSSTYTFSPSPGSTYTYSQNGILTGEADAAGDALTIAYGTPSPGSGNCPATAFACDTITSASGRALTTGQNSAGLVTSVTDPMDRAWTYSYTGSDLTKVTDPMGNITTYTYGAGTTGNPLNANSLLTITSPNAQPGGSDAGDSTVNVYNTFGQVTTQTDPSGYKTTFSYCVSAAAGNCMNASTGTGYVTVADPDGNTTVDAYTQGALTAESAWTAGTALSSEQDYVPDTTAGGSDGGTLLDTASADGDGAITTGTYDAAGDLTSSTSPDGVGSQAGTTTAEFTSLNLASCDGTVQAATPCSSTETGPSPVAPGGVITPPSSAPPAGVTYTLYDTDGNELYATTGVYEPGSNTASYSQASYQLFKGNSVTLGSTHISCTTQPPSASLPCATINPAGVVTQLAYNAQGDLDSSSSPDGNGTQLATTTDTYDADGEQLTEVAPDGNVSGGNAGNYTTATAWNADGQESSATLGGGTGNTDTPRIAYYGYDADGNQVTVKDPRGYTATTAFSADDRPVLVTNPAGHAALTCYDGAGHVAQTVPPAGVAAGSLTAASCPTSYPAGYTDRLATDATTYTYNAQDKQTAATTPAPAGQSGPQTTTFSYDGDGNLSTATAPATSAGGPAQVTADTYNAVGELASQTTGSGTSAASTVSYCYDPNGDTTSVVYADGNISGVASCETSSPWAVSSGSYPTQAAYQTTYAYDSAGEQVSATTPATSAAPSGATTTSTYDPDGNTLTTTDPGGVTVTRTYTPLDLTATVSYSGSSAHSVSYSYDADGSRTGMTDATGASSYIYDPFGELTSADNGTGQTTGYGYSADGQVTGITYPLPATATWASTDTVSYGYDSADELTSVTDFNGHQITVTPNADGLTSAEALGSTGDTIATTYDATDHPSVISLKNSGSTLASFTYSDAPAGNILSETDTPSAPQSPAVYTYDAKGRVTSMTPGTGSQLSYGFDASGNLTTLPGGAAGSYDHAGELTSSVLSGATTGYTYNADGEQLTAVQGGITIASGAWNGAGQLTSYAAAAANMTAATYDGDGLRATATISAGTKDFVWNTTSAVPQLIMDSTSAYIYAGSDTPAEQVSLSAGASTYLLADSLGSVRGTVSSAGTLTGTTGYTAWGSPQTAGGLTATTPFGYAGGYTDPDGLIYLLHRYYKPATGQFLSVDPAIAQTLQPYAYANDNPVSATDPTGLTWWTYETWEPRSRISADVYSDYSASMVDKIDKVTASDVAKHINTVARWLAALAASIRLTGASHAQVVAIIAWVSAVVALISANRLFRLVKWVKKWGYKGKHRGLYVTQYNAETIPPSSYVGTTIRACYESKVSCGSPAAHGKEYWPQY